MHIISSIFFCISLIIGKLYTYTQKMHVLHFLCVFVFVCVCVCVVFFFLVY